MIALKVAERSFRLLSSANSVDLLFVRAGASLVILVYTPECSVILNLAFNKLCDGKRKDGRDVRFELRRSNRSKKTLLWRSFIHEVRTTFFINRKFQLVVTTLERTKL